MRQRLLRQLFVDVAMEIRDEGKRLRNLSRKIFNEINDARKSMYDYIRHEKVCIALATQHKGVTKRNNDDYYDKHQCHEMQP